MSLMGIGGSWMVTGCLGLQISKSEGEQRHMWVCECVYVCVYAYGREKTLALLSGCSAPQRDSGKKSGALLERQRREGWRDEGEDENPNAAKKNGLKLPEWFHHGVLYLFDTEHLNFVLILISCCISVEVNGEEIIESKTPIKPQEDEQTQTCMYRQVIQLYFSD